MRRLDRCMTNASHLDYTEEAEGGNRHHSIHAPVPSHRSTPFADRKKPRDVDPDEELCSVAHALMTLKAL